MKPYGSDPWVDRRGTANRARVGRELLRHEETAGAAAPDSPDECPECSDSMSTEGFLSYCGARHCGCHPASCEDCTEAREWVNADLCDWPE